MWERQAGKIGLFVAIKALDLEITHYTNAGRSVTESKSSLLDLDASFSGVYLTSLGPENSTEKLVGNNWDDLTPSPALVKAKEARTEWVVEVPQGRAVRVGRNRDVYLHKGDLHLDSNCKIYRRSNPDEYWSCVLLWIGGPFVQYTPRSWPYERKLWFCP